MHDNKLWLLNDNKVSYSKDGLKWLEVAALEHASFKLASFNNELFAFGRNITNESGKEFFQKLYKLDSDGQWQLIKDKIDIVYDEQSFFREKNGQLFYFNYSDQQRHVSSSIWRSEDGINWFKGKEFEILFRD
jgi:hypothetical protein